MSAIAKPKKENLLTVKAFADLVGAHPKSIYRRIAAGRQPGAISIGRDYRIDVSVAIVAPKTSRASA